MEYTAPPKAGAPSVKISRVLANLFLILFLLDGALSVMDEVVSFIHPLAGIDAFRSVVAGSAILLSIPVYIALGLDRRLPKRIFLPLIAFVWLCPMLPSLFVTLSKLSGVGLIVALFQVLLFLLVTSRYWKSDRPGVMVPDALFEGPWFSWKNSAIFAAANVVVLPCLAVLLILSSANAYFEEHTAGFMHLSPTGLHMSEKVYRRGDKTVRLVSMIHVGEKQYYDKVLQKRYPGRTVVLAEGVTDRENLLKNRLDYGKFAGYLGLTSQRDEMVLKGRPIEASQLERPPSVREEEKGAGGEPDILRADVDLSSFRPSTVWFLNELGKRMMQGKSAKEQFVNCVQWWQENATPELEQTIFDDILHRRNIELIRNLRSALKQYDVVVVPWGAMHMPEVEAEVKQQGFTLQQVHDSVSVHFGK